MNLSTSHSLILTNSWNALQKLLLRMPIKSLLKLKWSQEIPIARGPSVQPGPMSPRISRVLAMIT